MAGALDVQKQGSDVGRLAREGDFDCVKVDSVIQDLLVEGSRWVVGPLADRLIAPWLSEVRDSYARVVLDVPLDSVSRVEVLRILVDDFFATHAVHLLLNARAMLPGPDLVHLLDVDQAPIVVVLEWLDKRVDGPIERLIYPESVGSDRVERNKVNKWRNGIDLPSLQGIKLFTTHLDQRIEAGSAASAGLWLMIAAALTRFERSFRAPIRPVIFRQMLSGVTAGHMLRQRLWEQVHDAARAWPELSELGSRLWHDLMRTIPKQAGDQDRRWREICLLEEMSHVLDPEGRLAYHSEWMKARWCVLSGRYEEALPHYERAFEMACYRAGSEIKKLIEEALSIAAWMEKKVFLKKLKHAGISLGLFAMPQGSSVIEDWELEELARQLPMLYPTQGLFVECEPELTVTSAGLMAISKEEIAAIKIDLSKPDRIRAVRFSNGDVRRWPQLRLFASFGMFEQAKALLDAGAPVDQLDSSNGSALLCAMQYAKSSGEREVLDLLLKTPHRATTLNAVTNKKRLTPLMVAIDLGMPDVVRKLLEQGADPNLYALTDKQSPLHYAVSQLDGIVYPKRMLERLTQALFAAPDLVQQDTLRRFGVGVAGVFGGSPILHANADAAMSVAHALVERHRQYHTVAQMTRIVETLLEAGADPNAAHVYPVPGRTPLMLAAESNLLEVFVLMVEHGGDTHLPDAAGQSCTEIAAAFQSSDIAAYLRHAQRL